MSDIEHDNDFECARVPMLGWRVEIHVTANEQGEVEGSIRCERAADGRVITASMGPRPSMSAWALATVLYAGAIRGMEPSGPEGESQRGIGTESGAQEKRE